MKFTCTACMCLADRETGTPADEFVRVFCHRCQGVVTAAAEAFETRREQEALDAETADLSRQIQRGML